MTGLPMRLIAALWDVDADALRGERLHAALAALGATRLQVNVCDDDARGGLAMNHFEQPIEAVVAVTGGDSADVLAALGGVAGTVQAWRTALRAPLDPDLPVGERVDALANVAFLRRPDDLAYDEWRRRWLDDHTPVAIDTQATFGYYQNIVAEPLTDDPTGVVAIVEELFPMEAISDVHAFYGSGGDRDELNRRITAMLASVSRIGAEKNIDVVPTSRYDYPLS
ncbi:hypothetical protein [Gordonia liuliyuniae]|uniref:EthD domain-containing protein n=1 Tax=Gordonia liuliyuniae TaxID=2911517 RepID=A0ABS9IXA5_9ACTN|nr:hypothetical protein [Gordonia liuliyuniae]MCF8590198.1 hypothetical protein [Gordonia liuliyuniae]